MEEGKKVTKLRTAFREKVERVANENGEEYGEQSSIQRIPSKERNP